MSFASFASTDLTEVAASEHKAIVDIHESEGKTLIKTLTDLQNSAFKALKNSRHTPSGFVGGSGSGGGTLMSFASFASTDLTEVAASEHKAIVDTHDSTCKAIVDIHDSACKRLSDLQNSAFKALKDVRQEGHAAIERHAPNFASRDLAEVTASEHKAIADIHNHNSSLKTLYMVLNELQNSTLEAPQRQSAG